MDVANRRPTRIALDLLSPRPGERILDAGCGTGAAMAALMRRAPCRVAGIDISQAMLTTARKRLARAQRRGDAELYATCIEDMPFADGSFDAAIALNILYFCDPECAMLQRLLRVLKPGGRLVAYVTHRDTMQHWPFALQGIHRLFDRVQLVRLFEGAGFAPHLIAVHEVSVTRSVKGLLAYAER